MATMTAPNPESFQRWRVLAGVMLDLAGALTRLPNTKRPRFALHTDRQVGVGRLVELYGLQPGEWFHWDEARPTTHKGKRWEEHVHLGVILFNPGSYRDASELIELWRDGVPAEVPR